MKILRCLIVSNLLLIGSKALAVDVTYHLDIRYGGVRSTDAHGHVLAQPISLLINPAANHAELREMFYILTGRNATIGSSVDVFAAKTHSLLKEGSQLYAIGSTRGIALLDTNSGSAIKSVLIKSASPLESETPTKTLPRKLERSLRRALPDVVKAQYLLEQYFDGLRR